MEKERLLFNINRFDQYFESINNKTSVYIAINTFLLGGVLTGYLYVEEYILKHEVLFNINLAIVMILGIVTLILLVLASIPYLDSKPNSLYYFGSIASYSKVSFTDRSKKYDTKDELKDLRSQVFDLSKGLSKKFSRLKIAGRFLLFQFILLIPLIIILISNKF